MVGVEGVNGPTAFDAIDTSGFANPKSINFALAFVSMMFAGFKSRWIIPCRCAFSSACAISVPIFRT